eukprot:TRINITY_DN46239_c0_g1_i3.p1 TRINITY_DN46239_c0_g1~~TRINITY_DN46239_c0_g1_i3.p1  ORF type:complete len:264 (+),score=31.86 TRINITY_DN46239_c0_g1_i3:52-792(+)
MEEPNIKARLRKRTQNSENQASPNKKQKQGQTTLESLRAKVDSPASNKRRRSLTGIQKQTPSSLPHHRLQLQKTGTDQLRVPEDEDARQHTWTPPASSYGLIQEQLYKDPWKVLVACMMLNRTSGRQVHGVIWDLFKLCPSAEEALNVSKDEIVEVIRPLGIHTKRANDMLVMSEQYLHKDWKSPLELHGVGKYAADAYWIFCKGKWREVQPRDKELNKYHEWLHKTEGQGCGFETDKDCTQSQQI